MSQPTLSPEQIQFQHHVTQVASAVHKVVEKIDPKLTVVALMTVLVSRAQATPFDADTLLDMLAQSWVQTRAMMDAIGVKPGEEPPADWEERVKKLMRDRGLLPPEAAPPPPAPPAPPSTVTTEAPKP